MGTKLDEWKEKIKQIAHENGYNENLTQLLELQDKIRNKQKQVDAKLNKIKGKSFFLYAFYIFLDNTKIIFF